jgi:amino acid adenylation domain-containing protein
MNITDNINIIDELTDENIIEIFEKMNETTREYDKNITVSELFEQSVNQNSDKIAIIYKDNKFTYKDINEKANSLAAFLIENGLKTNDIVGLLFERSEEMIISILGILKAGGTYLPLDPIYPEERIKYIINDCKVKFVLTNLNNPGYIDPKIEIIKYSDKIFSNDISENPLKKHKSEDPAYIIYTSGSTGNPKGVIITHKNLHNFIIGITDVIKFTQKNRILAITTICFDIFFLETILPLTQGSTIVIAETEIEKNPIALNDMIIKNNIDILQMTPSRIQLLLAQSKTQQCFASLKTIMIGGEAFPYSLLEKLKPLTKANIYNMYGPTETTVWSSVKELTNEKIITIGNPIANTMFYIVNELNSDKLSKSGELLISGDGVSKGYLKNDQLTNEKFIIKDFCKNSVVYRTGDYAELTSDNRIRIIGRIDNQVKIRGYRVELEEIETNILKENNIKQAAVIATDNNDNNNILYAFIVSDTKIEVAQWIEKLNNVLPDYMIPSHFVYVDKLPETPNGKIDRKSLVLSIKEKKEPINQSKMHDETTSLKHDLVQLIKDKTKASFIVDDIKGNEGLDTLGVTSLIFIEIVVDIETKFGFEFDDENFNFTKYKNINDLLEYILLKIKKT